MLYKSASHFDKETDFQNHKFSDWKTRKGETNIQIYSWKVTWNYVYSELLEITFTASFMKLRLVSFMKLRLQWVTWNYVYSEFLEITFTVSNFELRLQWVSWNYIYSELLEITFTVSYLKLRLQWVARNYVFSE